uniref:Uncharacterized protein n=1 Tax=Leviviridae sp. TaxID=2027243 RepID=A0A514D218_9VIRU|nr:MAG: hypothetical protein H2Bulk35999_000005 [Leviviridae sp.]
MSDERDVLNTNGVEDLGPRRYAYGIDRSAVRHD